VLGRKSHPILTRPFQSKPINLFYQSLQQLTHSGSNQLILSGCGGPVFLQPNGEWISEPENTANLHHNHSTD